MHRSLTCTGSADASRRGAGAFGVRGGALYPVTMHIHFTPGFQPGCASNLTGVTRRTKYAANFWLVCNTLWSTRLCIRIGRSRTAGQANTDNGANTRIFVPDVRACVRGVWVCAAPVRVRECTSQRLYRSHDLLRTMLALCSKYRLDLEVFT
jgi:hypothetical protein